jgi:hypothetical protein
MAENIEILQRARKIHWFKKYASRWHCEICKKNDQWQTPDGIVNLKLEYLDLGTGKMDGGPVPVFLASCLECGNIKLFSSIITGLTPKSLPPPNPPPISSHPVDKDTPSVDNQPNQTLTKKVIHMTIRDLTISLITLSIILGTYVLMAAMR